MVSYRPLGDAIAAPWNIVPLSERPYRRVVRAFRLPGPPERECRSRVRHGGALERDVEPFAREYRPLYQPFAATVHEYPLMERAFQMRAKAFQGKSLANDTARDRFLGRVSKFCR